MNKNYILLCVALLAENIGYTKNRLQNLQPQTQAQSTSTTSVSSMSLFNRAAYGVKVIFYDTSYKALTSQINISPNASITIPAGTTSISVIYNGQTVVSYYQLIKTQTTYSILYNSNNQSWSIK